MRPVEERLRRFLLWLAGGMCLGTIVELFLAKHTQDTIQFVPFVLCGAGAVAIAAALTRPQRSTFLALRGVMALLLAGSVLGVYEHLASNVSFEQEMRPGVALSAIWFQALRGAAPLLAPGILAIAAMIAIAATYAHPALEQRSTDALPARSVH